MRFSQVRPANLLIHVFGITTLCLFVQSKLEFTTLDHHRENCCALPTCLVGEFSKSTNNERENSGSCTLHRKYRHRKTFEETGSIILNPTAAMDKSATFVSSLPRVVPLRVAILEDPPFVQSNGERVYGLDIDVLDILAQQLNFSYELIRSDETEYGDEVNGTWTGLIGFLQREKMDLVLPTMSQTQLRSSVLDVSAPVSSSISQFMIRRPPPSVADLDIYLQPFSSATWLLLLVYGVATLIALALSAICHATWSATGHRFRRYRLLGDACFSVLSGAVQQSAASSVPPQRSGRVILQSWMLLCVILLGCYSSVLISYLAVEKYRLPFTSMDELVDNSEYRVGYVRGSAYEELLKVHKPPDGNVGQDIFYRLYRKVCQNPNNLVGSNRQGIQRALVQKYAFLSWLGGMLYEIGPDDCRFVFIGKHLLRRYGIALAKGSAQLEPFSRVLLRLQEGGVLRRLHKFYFPNSGDFRCRPATSRHPTDLHRVFTIFLVLIGGHLSSLLILLLERMCYSRTKIATLVAMTHPLTTR